VKTAGGVAAKASVVTRRAVAVIAITSAEKAKDGAIATCIDPAAWPAYAKRMYRLLAAGDTAGCRADIELMLL
jgi:uncharacterized Ntn-hydrolase superfamily protein